MAGSFITFEGGEGTGKSSQIKRLGNRLKAIGRSVVVTREPGGTSEAEKVRTLLVSGHVSRWSSEAEALLNYAARDSHLVQLIRPALDGGAIVLCDRFMDSTRAYQGYAGGCELTFIDALEAAIVGPTRPKLTLIFDLDPELGLARAKVRADSTDEDRYERKGLAFHRKLRDGFLDIQRRDPQRCHLVDASLSVDEVEGSVWSIVSELL